MRCSPGLNTLLTPARCTARRYNSEISLEDAIHTALLTLKEGYEGQMTEKTIEIGIVGESTAKAVGGDGKVMPVFKKLTEAEIKD